ncbi:hypothetical protein OS493_002096 [Desmophyllum pertusum]|uniref:WSC domain-containing protein n=1 Tax=Desmophyllum pertusum TaxID=174260 RepID=A0A9X0CTS9_9CNID|nr:hypothetical protein OS493_002096 [Desmophyllum pertusum]
MDKRLHLAFGFIVLLCLLRRTLTERDDLDDGAVRVPWYLGCYNNNEIAEDSSFKPVYKEDQITPVYCVRHCAFNESFRYAAVRNGNICFCLVQIDQDDSISRTLCNVSCLGDKNKLVEEQMQVVFTQLPFPYLCR